MKSIIIGLVLILFTLSSFCQLNEPTKILSREEYLSKSRTQKVVGFVLLGAGATTLLIISNGKYDYKTTGVLAIAGGVAVLGSIPFFISASKNKKRAMTATSFKFEKIQFLEGAGIVHQTYPALSLKFIF